MAMVLTSLRLVIVGRYNEFCFFDDYEEGTFTIGFTQSGTSGQFLLQHMNDTIGGKKLVITIFGHIRVSTVSGSGSYGNWFTFSSLYLELMLEDGCIFMLLQPMFNIDESTYGESLKSAPFTGV